MGRTTSVLVGVVIVLALIASCTATAPEQPADTARSLSVPSIEGARTLDCGDTVALNSADDGSHLTVNQVVFTTITAAGDGIAYPADNIVPVKDDQLYGYFAKTPILLPDEVSWVSVEVDSPGGTKAWAAWVPAGVWTTGSRGSWSLDEYTSSAVIINLDRCGAALAKRALLGGLAMDQVGCVDIVVRTSASPQGERHTIDYDNNGC